MITRLVTVVLLMASIAGCNTIAGLGQDIRKAGAAIERAAQ